MSRVKDIPFSAFQKEVLEDTYVVLVKFWAPWCGPCKALAPQLETLKLKYPDVKFVAPDISQDTAAAAALGVRSVPTVVIYDAGKPVKTIAGSRGVKPISEALIEVLRG